MIVTDKDMERFWSYVDKQDECWEWIGSKIPKGYGQFRINGTTVKVHRFVYEQLVGPIPIGMLILHACNNPACVNIEHLIVGDDHLNQLHSSISGRHQSKLRSHVTEIRKLYQQGFSLRTLGRKFGVTHCAIRDIIHEKNYVWVKDEEESDAL